MPAEPRPVRFAPLLVLVVVAAAAGSAPWASADEPAAEADDREILIAAPPSAAHTAEAGEYAGGGMRACTKCHDETEAYPVLSILATPHGVQGDERTPLASDLACETCHGPSAAHARDREEGEPRPAAAVAFGRDAPSGPQNDVCLSCHRGGDRIHWEGSAHESFEVACASCHRVHVAEDPMLALDLRPGVWSRSDQSGICFDCHPQQRAQVHRVSSHPLREGKIRCSDCHAPHGSAGPALLVRPTLNETCYVCHAEKRGPFLWEHAPVREDCSLCHTPHGSNHPTLLVQRQPQLCQQCHLASFHPSTAYTPPNVAGGAADFHVLDKGCLNCHSEVHGSNHPSGVRWTR